MGITAFVPCGKVGTTFAVVVCLGAPSSTINAALGLITVLLLTGTKTITNMILILDRYYKLKWKA